MQTVKFLTLWSTTNWKILKVMRIPDYLICPLRNLYAGQEATVRIGHETMSGSNLGKEYMKAVYCHPAFLTYIRKHYVKTSLDEAQDGIKTAGRSINKLRYVDETTLWQKAKRN